MTLRSSGTRAAYRARRHLGASETTWTAPRWPYTASHEGPPRGCLAVGRVRQTTRAGARRQRRRRRWRQRRWLGRRLDPADLAAVVAERRARGLLLRSHPDPAGH